MKIIFYGSEDRVTEVNEILQREVFFADSHKMCFELIDKDTLFLIDFDYNFKDAENLNKVLVKKHQEVKRFAIFGDNIPAKKAKKHGLSKLATDGYLSWPIDSDLLKDLLSEYKDEDSLGFDVKAFEVESDVRDEIDKHQLHDGEEEHLEKSLNLDIQSKFDSAFSGDEHDALGIELGEDEKFSVDVAGDEALSIDFDRDDDNLSVNLDTDEGLSVNLDTDEGLSVNLDTDEGLSVNLDTDEGLSVNLDTDEGLSVNLDTDEDLSINLDIDEGLNVSLDEDTSDLNNDINGISLDLGSSDKSTIIENNIEESGPGELSFSDLTESFNEGEEAALANSDVELDGVDSEAENVLNFSLNDDGDEKNEGLDDLDGIDFDAMGITSPQNKDMALGDVDNHALEESIEELEVHSDPINSEAINLENNKEDLFGLDDIDEEDDIEDLFNLDSMDEESDDVLNLSQKFTLKNLDEEEEDKSLNFSMDEVDTSEDMAIEANEDIKQDNMVLEVTSPTIVATNDMGIDEDVATETLDESDKDILNFNEFSYHGEKNHTEDPPLEASANESSVEFDQQEAVEFEAPVENIDEQYDENKTMMNSPNQNNKIINNHAPLRSDFNVEVGEKTMMFSGQGENKTMMQPLASPLKQIKTNAKLPGQEEVTGEFQIDRLENNSTNATVNESYSRNRENHSSLNEVQAMSTYHENELMRLKGIIRQLREEREENHIHMDKLRSLIEVKNNQNLGEQAQLDEVQIELSILKKRHNAEIEEARYQMRLSDEKREIFEQKSINLQKEFQRMGQKVRIDLNQIQQKEKELEGQLELVTNDSEIQLASRNKKILELKRKIDALEFNMENISIKEISTRRDKVKIEERLNKIMKTIRGSIDTLYDENDDQNVHQSSKVK